MPANNIPLINGVAYGWANITVIMFNVPMIAVTKISYKVKQDKKNNYGFGTEPISRGYGNREYDGSIELSFSEWARICDASPLGDPLSIPPFDVIVAFGGDRVTARKHTLRAVEFMEDPMEGSQGDTDLKLTIPIIYAGLSKR